MDIFIILQRFAVMFILSLLFGLERQRSHKPIGFGTFIFVSLGACGLAITALTLNSENALPLLGSIVTGIGFLGAGALIKTGDKIFGVTTAAGIWLFAIIGLIIGIGEYVIGLIIYSLVWLVILIDKNLEKKGMGMYHRRITITANKKISEANIRSILCAKNCNIISTEANRKNKQFSITVWAEGSKKNIALIPERLIGNPSIESFKIE